MNENYLKDIKKLFSETFGLEDEEITPEAYFEDDLNIGQMELREQLEILEEKYTVEFEEEEKEELETVEDLISLLTEKLE